MMKKLLIQILCVFAVINQSIGQAFTKIEINNPQGVYNGKTYWIDFDNDNDLDFIITGQSTTNDLHTRLYLNNGSDQFDLYTSLAGYSDTGLELINSNNDDFIDLILVGRAIGIDNDQIIYTNNSSYFIPESIISDFLVSGSGSVISGDWNNDMNEDILITGINDYLGGNPIIETKLYSKNGPNEYTTSSPIDIGVYLSAAAFFDIDNDRDLDLIISGNGGEFPYQITNLYINENQSYTLSNNKLVGLQNTAIDIGDYNNDGYMDVILTGLNEFLRDTTLLYKNVNGELISVENSGLTGVNGTGGSVNWGDYDNDGDLDLLFNGGSSNIWPFQIMINQGNDQFTHLDEENFENLVFGSAKWGDYDNDGDLDILATGYTDDVNPRLIVFRNDLSTSNTSPSIPTNLITSTSAENNNVDFSWENSTDNETAQAALTYNLHVVDLETNVLFSSFAELSTGFLRRVSTGNMGNSNSWKFENLKDGQYFGYIQAIDGAFSSSQFSEPSVFYIGIPIDVGNLSLSEKEDGVQLVWTDNSNNEEFFIIERSVGDENNFELLDSVGFNKTNFIDSKLPPSFTAFYRIRAINPNGTSNNTEIASISTDGTPSNLEITSTNYGIKLLWNDNSNNEEFFIIERSVDDENNFEPLDSVGFNETSFIDSKLPPSFSAFYRIQAANPYGKSDYSEISSISEDGIPTDLSIEFVSNGIRISWADNSGTEEYFIIERKREEDAAFVKIDSVISNVTEYVDYDDLKNPVLYRLYSKNNLGISQYSEVQIVILSIEESIASSLTTYPNPYNGSIFIEARDYKLGDHQIDVFNLNGNSVPFKIKNHDTNRFELQIEDQISGVFFIRIHLNNEIFSIKVIKE